MDSYKQLIHDFGMDIAEKAGYIPPQSCQNLKEAQEYSPVTDNYCLITTGCFAPLHTGHVQLLTMVLLFWLIKSTLTKNMDVSP